MAVKTVFITASGTFTVPSDFYSLASIEAIGGGAGGRTSSTLGRGGGGGAYAKITSLSGIAASSTLYVEIGTGGSAGVSGTDTWLNKSSSSAPGSTSDGLLAKGGGVDGVGGSAGSCVGTVTYSGGNSASNQLAGGGAAGPSANGSNAASSTTGGAGNGGLSGGGAGGTPGNYATSTPPGNGGAGTYWTQTSNSATAGPGGGAGGAVFMSGGSGGLYGGAGAGGYGSSSVGGSGAQGIIVFTYYDTATNDSTLATTETQDVASFTLTVPPQFAMAATDARDAASFTLTAAHTAALAATDAVDTAAVAIVPVSTADLTATEAADTALFGIGAGLLVYFGITEPGDIASATLTAKHTAALAASESSDSVAIVVVPALTATLAITERPDTAAITSGSDLYAVAPSYSTWAKRRNKDKPVAPQLPKPEQAGEIVVDEAVLRQIEEEQRAALVLQQKQEALQRVEDLRAYFPEPRPTRTMALPARQDVVESSPEIRRRIVTLFREPTPSPATDPVRGSVTLHTLGPRNLPRTEIKAARYVSLRRASSRQTQSG